MAAADSDGHDQVDDGLGGGVPLHGDEAALQQASFPLRRLDPYPAPRVFTRNLPRKVTASRKRQSARVRDAMRERRATGRRDAARRAA